MGLLDAGDPEVFQDDLHEVAPVAVVAAGLVHAVDKLVVFVHRQHPMGREAFHRERAGDPDHAFVFVGLVVEVFVVGLGGD
ncbi:MAG: hypothetical protein M3Z21_08650, partial [Pseudomonadota bacterium]|nr:hypothetical protein [Pseudomonadota bacterium]